MACFNIMAVLISHRSKKAPEVQEILTKHGCKIKVRIGLHDAGGDLCSEEGLVILQLTGEDNEIKELEADLNSLDGVKAQNMSICSE